MGEVMIEKYCKLLIFTDNLFNHCIIDVHIYTNKPRKSLNDDPSYKIILDFRKSSFASFFDGKL